MENNFIYIVYLTTNIKNNKIYIGVHKTLDNNKFDGYIGCGLNRYKPSTLKNPKTNFQYAVKKYGWDAFVRYTIAEFKTEDEALQLESILVTSNFVNRVDTYNTALGGERSFNNTKSIYKFDYQGNLLKQYNSLTIAANENNLWSENIGIAAIKKTNYGNYYWSFETKINVADYSQINQDKLVYVYNSQGKFIRTYESVSQVAQDYDIVRESMRDKIYKMTKYQGKYFSYTSPDKFSLKINPSTVIYKYDLSGNFIEQDTLSNFSNYFHTTDKKLYQIANAKLSAFKYQWNLENPNKMTRKTSYENNGMPKKVAQYDLQGNLVKIWKTVTSCKKEFSNLTKVLNGQLSKTKGYTFKYVD